ncbi:MAG: hypothetical protein WBM32_09650 [Crocosphaera sp.]|jgi:hypothetical protein
MKNISNPLVFNLYTKSLTRILPFCSISILVLLGYFSTLFGGLMIGLGGAMVYQSLRSIHQQKLPETFIVTSEQINSL